MIRLKEKTVFAFVNYAGGHAEFVLSEKNGRIKVDHRHMDYEKEEMVLDPDRTKTYATTTEAMIAIADQIR